jgi:hypothetical protein
MATKNTKITKTIPAEQPEAAHASLVVFLVFFVANGLAEFGDPAL